MADDETGSNLPYSDFLRSRDEVGRFLGFGPGFWMPLSIDPDDVGPVALKDDEAKAQPSRTGSRKIKDDPQQ